MAKSRNRRKTVAVDPFMPPVEAARAADLRYVSDERPGISRRRSGKGFSYSGPDGVLVRDKATLARIRSLAIPPAWTSVWICPLDNGHIQATGRDARGRKQYRYHPRWHLVRDDTKYGRMILFGNTLPRIRARVEADLALSGIPKAKVLATVVRLLETTFIRVGNEEYARSNRSFGLTTLQNRHVEVSGSTIHFHFRGKSGKDHSIKLSDRRLARLVQRCRELPGQDLFQYRDDAGDTQPIDSTDVNAYIRDVSGQEFTAKDFRTWAGTLLATRQLATGDGSEAPTLVAAIAAVAQQLGNTVAVCRKCYIHPAVINAYQQVEVRRLLMEAGKGVKPIEGLESDEAVLIQFLSAAA